ncbi:hypothetical protein VTP01DRAFT_8923 [Rhizomucor pusillus]|uniref:uncharacterized protein n=1 Tax=Rhizomucor pusillus TaxID=4840 RepID=UPI0037423CDF
MTDAGTKEKITVLSEEGSRAYSLGEYEICISKLGEACQLLDSLYGELAKESGDAYFLYGRALLQSAIQRNSVLGQSGQEQQPPAVQQQATDTKNKDARFQFEDEAPAEEEEEEEEEKQQEKEEEEGEAPAEEAEEDDFETAWDVLDVARVIFEKGEDKESKLKLADVHLCLADLSAETEKFSEALVDYKKALDIKHEVLSEDDRQLAEAHYKYALALEFVPNESVKAGPEIQKAIDVLKKRKAALEEIDQGKGKGKATEADTDTSKEIAELGELIPEMELKLEELTTRQNTEKEAEKLLRSLLGGSQLGSASAQQQIDQSAVNDLTMKVKRKVQEKVQEAAENAKRPKTDNS